MVICEKCNIKNKIQNGVNNIFEFPFKIYTDKKPLKDNLLNFINNHPNCLQNINNEYESNIIHEIVYKLIKSKYNDKLYRKQYIWALEILSELPEYPELTTKKNCKNEMPIEAYVRLSEDNHSKQYSQILNLLLKNFPIEFKLTTRENDIINDNNNENNKLIIVQEKKRIINPQVSVLTNQYHTLQTNLFSYLENNYNSLITKCELCNIVIDIFEDLDRISKELKKDKNIKIIIKMIENIIEFRKKGIELSEEDEVNRRHKYIIKYFEKLLEEVKIEIDLENI